jgi:hypothetical protein
MCRELRMKHFRVLEIQIYPITSGFIRLDWNRTTCFHAKWKTKWFLIEEIREQLHFDYFVRRIVSLFGYYAYGLIKYDFDHDEEDDELKRDIVGHDVYGAIRHLHRPDMEFYRYTRYDDLTAEEQKMVRRTGWRSFLNLGSPLLIGKNEFRIHPGFAFNISLGYTMSPFGDFIDQNFWFKLRSRQVYNVYLRQHQNKKTGFRQEGSLCMILPGMHGGVS